MLLAGWTGALFELFLDDFHYGLTCWLSDWFFYVIIINHIIINIIDLLTI